MNQNEKEALINEVLLQEERHLFTEMCVSIASKNFNIDANSLVAYVSQVCDGFRERFSNII